MHLALHRKRLTAKLGLGLCAVGRHRWADWGPTDFYWHIDRRTLEQTRWCRRCLHTQQLVHDRGRLVTITHSRLNPAPVVASLDEWLASL